MKLQLDMVERGRLRSSTSFLLCIFLVELTLKSVSGVPIYGPQFLPGGSGRNIRHLPCVSRRSGETGVCMFAFTCAKANGTHLGTCIDRFYFGSCCKIDDEPDISPQDNAIEESEDILATTQHNSLESNDIPNYVSRPKPDQVPVPMPPQKPGPGLTSQFKPAPGSTTLSKPTPGSVSRPKPTSTSTTQFGPSSSTIPPRPISASTTQTKPVPEVVPQSKPTSEPISQSKPGLKPEKHPQGSLGTLSTDDGVATLGASTPGVGTTVGTTSTGAIKVPGSMINKVPGSSINNVPGSSTSKVPGSSTSKVPGSSTSKVPGSSTSKFPGSSTSKVPGSSTSKFPGSSTSKVPGPPTIKPTWSPETTTQPYGLSTFQVVRNVTEITTKPTLGSSQLPQGTDRPQRPVTSTYPTFSPLTTRRPIIHHTTSKIPEVEETTKPFQTSQEGSTFSTTPSPSPPVTRFPPRSTTTVRPTKTTTRRPSTRPSSVSYNSTRPVSAGTKPRPSGSQRPRPTPTKPRPSVPVKNRPTTTSRPRPTTTPRPRPTSSTSSRPRPTSSTLRPGSTSSSSRPGPTSTPKPRPTTLKPRPTTTQTTSRPPPSKAPPTSKPTSSVPVSTTSTTPTSLPSTISEETLKRNETKLESTIRPVTVPKPAIPAFTTQRPGDVSSEGSEIYSSNTVDVASETTKISPRPSSTTTETPVSSSSAPVVTTWSTPQVTNETTLINEVLPPKESSSEGTLTTSPGLVTWTFTTEEGSTRVPEPSSTTASTVTPEESTETEWAPITTPDGWVMIPSPGSSPSEELPSPPSPPSVKPLDKPTPATSTESPTTERVTSPRPTTTTPSSTISTLEMMTSEAPPVAAALNMSNYKQVCGRRLFPESRIVGGDHSSFGKWPWQISLRQWRTSTYLHKCGAALLNENWAITAAHCVENVTPSDLLLRIGEHDLTNENEPYGYQERRVQIVASHPQFDPRTFEYDLALLRFYEPLLPFQPNALPICLPEDDENYVGHTAYVTGWGRLYDDGPLPSVLQEVSVPVINNTVCEAMYRNAGYVEHIPHIFICAGWRKGGFDSCEGDSGGPMVIQRPKDKRWILAGVISWGIGCAEPDQPGVYTRISEFREWINQILQF
ncbi:mucin-5AC [Orussus abietinus]|uniref:mucin-5AC n=1 Tax=Orussus abietinus TaxID=222816 RepID=UPI000C7162E4|nr:mucin-5AC [Orussus abietinus]